MSRKLAVAMMVALAGCSSQQQQAAAPPAPPPGPARGTNEWKIQNAMSAAPADIASGAAIMDYPSTPTGQPTQLRAGTNGWVCFPDLPSSPANDPICADAQWQDWFNNWMAHKPPKTTAVGVAYMLQGADDASNTDAFKEKPDSGQQWVHTGPHTMIIAPNAAHMFSGYPTTPTPGKPFVMFPNTPYAHIMVPSPGLATHGM